MSALAALSTAGLGLAATVFALATLVLVTGMPLRWHKA
jgi:hypothetical protein